MPVRYDAGFAGPPMETPLLVSLVRALRGVILLATVLLTVAMLRTQQSIVNIPLAAFVATGGVRVSMVPVRLAQVILLAARIEPHPAAQKDAAILQSLHKIETHLDGARAVGER